MGSSESRVVATFLVLVTVLGTVSVLPVSAIEPISNSTYANPSAPGATADFRATVVAEEGDSITENGLQSVTLDFSADPDYSGSVADITARDTEIRVSAPGGNGTVPAGPVEVSANPAGDQLTVTLISPYRNIDAGDEISVRMNGIRNTEIAIPNPQGLRGFALDISTTGPQNGTDGPVEARYTINPEETASNATTTMNDSGANTTQAGNGTTMTNGSMANGTETDASSADPTQTEAGSTTAAMTTESTTTESTTTAMTAESTTTTAGDGGGAQTTTGTTGPGFGLVGAVIAMLAVSLLALRRRN